MLIRIDFHWIWIGIFGRSSRQRCDLFQHGCIDQEPGLPRRQIEIVHSDIYVAEATCPVDIRRWDYHAAACQCADESTITAQRHSRPSQCGFVHDTRHPQRTRSGPAARYTHADDPIPRRPIPHGHQKCGWRIRADAANWRRLTQICVRQTDWIAEW